MHISPSYFILKNRFHFSEIEFTEVLLTIPYMKMHQIRIHSYVSADEIPIFHN